MRRPQMQKVNKVIHEIYACFIAASTESAKAKKDRKVAAKSVGNDGAKGNEEKKVQKNSAPKEPALRALPPVEKKNDAKATAPKEGGDAKADAPREGGEEKKGEGAKADAPKEGEA